MTFRWLAVPGMLIFLGPTPPTVASADEAATIVAPIATAAAWGGVASELLAAVVWVESRGQAWALNVDGATLLPQTHAQALSIVRAAGGRADIGLAQIHYPIWGPVFGLQPEDLLDPWTNLHVATVILRHAMHQEPGSWGGVGRYHSATPWRKWWYAHRVATVVHALRVRTPRPEWAPRP